MTFIYRKKTFTGLYSKWDSFIRRKYIINLIRTLTYRCYQFAPPLLCYRSALDELRNFFFRLVTPRE